MAPAPKSVTIRSYNVGFGDCYLLSFKYAKSERHVLIDYGSTGLPKGAPKSRMVDIAKDVEDRTRGKLHAVVATHRHRDHISGFETKKGGGGTGDIIRSLKPSLVVQPWTEDPKLATNAMGPKSLKGLRAKLRGARPLAPGVSNPAALRFAARSHVASLDQMNKVAELIAKMALPRSMAKELRDQLSFLGESNLKNLSAVKNLMTMARNSYVYSGAKSGLEKVLPGVKIHVLGPPTLKQTETIRKQRAKDADEFWHLTARAVAHSQAADGGSSLFPRYVRVTKAPYPVDTRWLIYQARRARASQLLQLVRILDTAMNNTSVILLFEVGEQKLLFPGDAQIENWQYALAQEKYGKLLRSVNLYKVGHHGSLNATPKSLWKLFDRRGPKKKGAKRLKSLMSTLEGKHGSVSSRTEVPRRPLVTALHDETDHFSTQMLEKADMHRDITIDF